MPHTVTQSGHPQPQGRERGNHEKSEKKERGGRNSASSNSPKVTFLQSCAIKTLCVQPVFSNPFESPTPLLSPRGRSEKYRPRRGRRVTRDFSLLRYTPTSSSSQIKNYQCSFPLAAAARCRERERKKDFSHKPPRLQCLLRPPPS